MAASCGGAALTYLREVSAFVPATRPSLRLIDPARFAADDARLAASAPVHSVSVLTASAVSTEDAYGGWALPSLAAAAAAVMAGRAAGRARRGARRRFVAVVQQAAPAGGYCEAPEACVRRTTRTVDVGGVLVGSSHPVRTQTMTTTPTHDVEATVAQIKRCADAGVDIVRITVQGMKEARACKLIKEQLLKDGYSTPLVADIHFTPKVAMLAADYVDKIRVNPGNFTDGKKTFDTVSELTEEDTQQARLEIEEKFGPLVLKLKEKGKALRIGVNHGSLSERILFQYGDTPEGMIASAMEYGEICRAHDYHNFVFSMKSSNPQVMVRAYRLLAKEMYQRGWDYPLHLGVTEAGGGSDGRIKSAVGIGALLLDGLGDTIRVSLTEDPEFEAQPTRALRDVAASAQGRGVPAFGEPSGRRELGPMQRRKCQPPLDVPLNADGSVLAAASAHDLETSDLPVLCRRFGLKYRDGSVGRGAKSVDAFVVKGEVPISARAKLQAMIDARVGVLCKAGPGAPEGATILLEASDASNPMPERIGGYAVVFSGDESAASVDAVLRSVKPRFVLLRPADGAPVTFIGRRFFAALSASELGAEVPAILWFQYPARAGEDEDDVVVRASSEFGSLFVDGLGEGVLWDAEALGQEMLTESSFNLLQACRMRISKTEFISCPSCGRTLFNLQKTVASIKERTGHLPGVRIAVMGCIVNGPGEMADADFGYVGSGVGKIDLYVNYDCVQRGIPSENAVDQLIVLIKKHGRWQDPPPPDENELEDLEPVPAMVL